MHSIIIVKFGDREIAKGKFYVAKRPIKICDFIVDNIVVSKLVKAKINSKYLIGYLNKAIRSLVLIIPKMSRYIKTFKVKEGNEKLLENLKAVWTNIEDLKNIKLNALPVYGDRYIKTEVGTFGDKVYTNYRFLNVPQDDTKCDSFTVISIDSLLVYDKNIICEYI